MPMNFSDFLEKMDDRQWFRMVICFLPGLIFVKLSAYFADGSMMSWISSFFLLAGVAIYLAWSSIRRIFSPEGDADVDLIESDGGNSGMPGIANVVELAGREQLLMLAELRAICEDEERESDRLIAKEIAVNPNLTFSEATRSALERRRIFGRQ